MQNVCALIVKTRQHKLTLIIRCSPGSRRSTLRLEGPAAAGARRGTERAESGDQGQRQSPRGRDGGLRLRGQRGEVRTLDVRESHA